MDGWRLIVQIMDNLKDIQNMTSKLLFFDLETTGVKFWRNGIHQIGGIVDIDGQEAERFDIRLAPNPAATIEQEAHDDEYFSVEDHNSAIVLPKGTIRRLTGRDLKWEDDPISLKSVIEGLPHVDIEFYKQKIINFVKWI